MSLFKMYDTTISVPLARYILTINLSMRGQFFTRFLVYKFLAREVVIGSPPKIQQPNE